MQSCKGNQYIEMLNRKRCGEKGCASEQMNYKLQTFRLRVTVSNR